jgi:formylglycine-generating enzyme required for sulfatase activity
MASVAAGGYTPLFQDESAGTPVPVKAFYLDRYPVTNARYLAFVPAQPQWRRSRVPPLLADATYRQHWQGDVPPVEATAAWFQSPVTQVSWFAARAYCAWQHRRLPSMAEWESREILGVTPPSGSPRP